MTFHDNYLFKSQERESSVKIEQIKIIEIQKNLYWEHVLINKVMINGKGISSELRASADSMN